MRLITHAGSHLLGALVIMVLSTGPSQGLESPEQMLTKAMATQLLKAKDQMTGEGVCWHAAYQGERFIEAYEATKDAAYLRAGEQWYDALIAQMYTSPDGYRGFVGETISGGPKLADCHVGDAIVCNIFLAHAELVLKDAALIAEFGARARGYVKLVEKNVLEKWTERGTWWQNGPFGGYIVYDKFLTESNKTVFQQGFAVLDSIGYQFNKQLDMAICHLRLFRITGNQDHREKARLIFNHSKVRLNLYDDHYVWNYWEPFYPKDIYSGEKLSLWVATHPYRNYQAGEVSNFVEAFHSGLTFDETDLKRLIQTNLHMWNGDKDKPAYKNSDDEAVVASTGKAKDFVESKAYPSKAGCLWTSLCEFSPELAEIGKRTATNPGFTRAYDLPVTVFEVPFSSCANINMALVMPAATVKGGLVQCVSKFRGPGPVEILLCDDQGAVLSNIFTGDHSGGNDGQEGILIKGWVADVASGTYRIRWRSGETYRDYRIYVE